MNPQLVDASVWIPLHDKIAAKRAVEHFGAVGVDVRVFPGIIEFHFLMPVCQAEALRAHCERQHWRTELMPD